jgi:hypothetical protein
MLFLSCDMFNTNILTSVIEVASHWFYWAFAIIGFDGHFKS